MTLQRSHEMPQRYRLFVQWETLENHTKDFRESADFQEWRKLVGHCFSRRRMSSTCRSDARVLMSSLRLRRSRESGNPGLNAVLACLSPAFAGTNGQGI